MAFDTENIKYFKSLQNQLLRARTIEKMARLLGIEHRTLDYMAERPQYDEFDVPKKSGGFRHIEDPDDALKEVLSKAGKQFFIPRFDAFFAEKTVFRNKTISRTEQIYRLASDFLKILNNFTQ